MYTVGEQRKAEADERQRRALEHALDIRKFEIDLTWRRAAYFWAIIAAIFAGYFLIMTKLEEIPEMKVNAFVVACLGFIFSIAWYQANRAGSFWQRNWEAHVDLLEDAVIGSLHKTVRDPREFRFWRLTGPYAFSLAQTNIFLSLFVVAIWGALIVQSGMMIDWTGAQAPIPKVVAAVTGLASLCMLIFFGPMKISRYPNPDQSIPMVTRRVERSRTGESTSSD